MRRVRLRRAWQATGPRRGYRARVDPRTEPAPGTSLGLPAAGRGSLAGFGRRFAALAIDWAACLLIVRAAARGLAYGSPGYSVLVLAVFAAEVWVLTSFGGASAGQRSLGLQVVRLDGAAAGVVRAAVRTALLCLVFPALIWDREARGLHDRLAGTVLVRTG